MLSPVANHQAESHDGKRKQEHKESSPPVELPHGVMERIAAQLPECRLGGKQRPALADKVEGQVKPHQQIEASDIVQKLPYVVSLVADGRAQIVRAVALDVVVFDVVVKVTVPGVAHQGVGDVGEAQVEPRVLFFEDTSPVDVLVHHERVGARVGDLHDQMEDTVEPGEVREQEQGGGDRGGEVEDEMCQKDDIGLVAHD